MKKIILNVFGYAFGYVSAILFLLIVFLTVSDIGGRMAPDLNPFTPQSTYFWLIASMLASGAISRIIFYFIENLNSIKKKSFMCRKCGNNFEYIITAQMKTMGENIKCPHCGLIYWVEPPPGNEVKLPFVLVK